MKKPIHKKDFYIIKHKACISVCVPIGLFTTSQEILDLPVKLSDIRRSVKTMKEDARKPQRKHVFGAFY